MMTMRKVRCLAGSMAMTVLAGVIAASCSAKQTDDRNTTQQTDGENTTQSSEDTGKISYMAQAKAFEALSVEERAGIDLGDNGYSVISKFTDDTLYPLYRATMENGEDNFLYSPTSLYLALAVLAECEDTEGAAELYKLLGVSGSEEMVSLVNKLTASLISEGDGDICQIANSLWVEEGYPWYEQAYTIWDTLANNMGLDVFQMNLHNEEAGIKKNTWISEHTGGLLGNGEPESWRDDTHMVILNTVYFDKNWKLPFKAAFTTDSSFTKADGTKVTCKMMHKEICNYSYLETDKYLASKLEYQDGSYMLFMLPQGDTLAEGLLESDLTNAVNAYREGNTKQADLVKFSVPKLDYSVSVEGIMEQLEALGLSTAFSTEAFQNLVDTELKVSSISQDTRILVDEKGTKAAAVTEIAANDAMPMYETIIDIDLNRPYAYAIVSANGTILFSGIVNDPTAE